MGYVTFFWLTTGEIQMNETITAIIAIVIVVMLTAIANFFGASVETTFLTGVITAIAALATPGKDKE